MKRRIHGVGLATMLVLGGGFQQALGAPALNPADRAREVCPDTLLRVTFNTPPVLGDSGHIVIKDSMGGVVDDIDLGRNNSRNAQSRIIGGATFTNYPVLISNDTVAICPHLGVLKRGETYRVTIGAGAFAQQTNELSWSFSTRRAGPGADATRLVVAADGSGDFCTVQGAIDFVPAGNMRPITIFIRNGVYEEIVYVTNKNGLTLQGEDRKQTIIQYANNENFNYRSLARNLYRQTLGVMGDDFTLENLTVHNTTPKRGSQAEAVRIDGQRGMLRNVDLLSFQDTVKLSGTVYVRDAYIEGDVDFIWGYGTCFFKNCEIKCVTSGACVTQIRNDQSHFGAVFVDCRLTRAAGVTNATLSRIEVGRFPYSHVAWINCAMDGHIRPDAWRFTPGPSPPDHLRFWEYHTTDLAGKTLDVSQRAAISRQINDAEAAQMRDAKFVLGGWEPR